MEATVSGEDVCWVCLDAGSNLIRPCKCPRAAHAKCLARWQLQSAGRDEEKTCRFCNHELPDWRPVLTPKHLDKAATPVVSVFYNGTHHRIEVRPGAEGFEQFRLELHKITGLPLLDCMQITFQCKSPDTAQDLSFKGISAFDAAIHCASVSAAERQRTRCIKTRRAGANGSSSSYSSSGTGSGSGSPSNTPGTSSSDSSGDDWNRSSSQFEGEDRRGLQFKGLRQWFKRMFNAINTNQVR